jgi:ribonucleotide reductase beta subunit family protein with ferritin-like domain
MSNVLLDSKNDVEVLDNINLIASWNAFEEQLSKMWSHNQVNMAKDISELKEGLLLPDKEINDRAVEALKKVQTYFAIADSIVVSYIKKRLLSKLKATEAVAYFTIQSAIEFVHQRSYGLMFKAVIPDKDERDIRLCEARSSSVIAEKNAWCKKFLLNDDNSDSSDFGDYNQNDAEEQSLAKDLFGLALTEGIFFPNSFLFITWFVTNTRGKLQGILQYNNLISRDELLHAKEDIKHYNYISPKNKLPEAAAHIMTKEAVDIEFRYAQELLGKGLPGLPINDVRVYIECIANLILIGAGYKECFPIQDQPFEFMHVFYAEQKKNFFELKPTEYALNGSAGIREDEEEISYEIDV